MCSVAQFLLPKYENCAVDIVVFARKKKNSEDNF
jgi:hypothetical protein